MGSHSGWRVIGMVPVFLHNGDRKMTLTKTDVEDALRRVLDSHNRSPWFDTEAAATYLSSTPGTMQDGTLSCDRSRCLHSRGGWTMSAFENGSRRAEGTSAPASAEEKAITSDATENVALPETQTPSHDPQALDEHIAAGHELIPIDGKRPVSSG
jgi:hypothetical protein